MKVKFFFLREREVPKISMTPLFLTFIYVLQVS